MRNLPNFSHRRLFLSIENMRRKTGRGKWKLKVKKGTEFSEEI